MRDSLVKRAKEMGISISETQADAFAAFHEMLARANAKMNLTRVPEDADEAVDRDPFAGPDHDQVACADGLYGHLLLRAVAQHVALVPGVQQGLDFAGNGRQPDANIIWNRLWQFIIRKIKHGLDVRRNGEQGVVERANPAAEGVFELGGGQPRGTFGTGLDEVENGLRLGQVDLSI